MAGPAKLKVFRTAIGFHDAYVAAPSQKAALKAWGSDADLFARGLAEPVTDPALMAEPLATPGTVVKRSRGSMDDHLAALPAAGPKPKAQPASRTKPAPAKPVPPRPAPPRPSRAELDAAQAALDTLVVDQRTKDEELRERERAIAAERKAFDRDQARAVQAATDVLDRARVAHDAALNRWLAARS